VLPLLASRHLCHHHPNSWPSPKCCPFSILLQAPFPHMHFRPIFQGWHRRVTGFPVALNLRRCTIDFPPAAILHLHLPWGQTNYGQCSPANQPPTIFRQRRNNDHPFQRSTSRGDNSPPLERGNTHPLRDGRCRPQHHRR
jgi:hypothetical protein